MILFIKKSLLFCLFFVGFSSIFIFDLLNVRTTDSSTFFDLDSDRLILSRMLYSEFNGLLSGSGFLTTLVANKEEAVKALADNDFRHYVVKNNFKEFYLSQSGFSGFFVSVLNKFYKFKNISELQMIYQAVLVFMISIMCYLLFTKIDRICALLIFFALVSSNILIYASGSIYWFVALYYLPVVTVLYYFSAIDNLKKHFFFILFISFLLKFLAGFEHITTIALVPISLYWMLTIKFDISHRLITIFKIFMTSIAAFVAALLIWYVQLSNTMVLSFTEKINIITQTAVKRSSSEFSKLFKFSEIEQNFGFSLNVSLKEVFSRFILETPSSFIQFRYLHLVNLFLLLTLILFVLTFLKKKSISKRLHYFTLPIFVFLPHASWLLFGKAHAYIHEVQTQLLSPVSTLILAPLCLSSLINVIFKDIAKLNILKPKAAWSTDDE